MGTESRESFRINQREARISYAESRRSRVERCKSHIPRSTYHIRDEVYSGLGVKGIKTPSAFSGALTAPFTTT